MSIRIKIITGAAINVITKDALVVLSDKTMLKNTKEYPGEIYL
jgi:hypothetical protein